MLIVKYCLVVNFSINKCNPRNILCCSIPDSNHLEKSRALKIFLVVFCRRLIQWLQRYVITGCKGYVYMHTGWKKQKLKFSVICMNILRDLFIFYGQGKYLTHLYNVFCVILQMIIKFPLIFFDFLRPLKIIINMTLKNLTSLYRHFMHK